AFVARLFDRRTGVYSALVLSTMPLYFVQARSMMGDVCTMAGLAMAFGGPTPLGKRVPYLLMAVLGLAVGFETRGGLIGVGVPALSVGVAWAVSRVAAKNRTADGAGTAVGIASLLVATAAAVMAARVIATPGDSKDLSLWV